MNGTWKLEAWDWPLRQHSQFHQCGGISWHVQRSGAGPPLLLIHGTGASLHSWTDLIPELERHFDVLAVDLPGHGFTELPSEEKMSLPGMATALHLLLEQLAFSPSLVVGHSAGAAVAVRMHLNQMLVPAALVSLNGALLALPGMTGWFFSASARLLARMPAVPAWFAGLGGREAFTARLIDSTGSRLNGDAANRYRQLVGNPRHVAAALKMMANWQLEALETELPDITVPLHLVACSGDLTVPPAQSAEVAKRVPGATLHRVAGLGHLGHEEDPAQFVRLIRGIAGA